MASKDLHNNIETDLVVSLESLTTAETFITPSIDTIGFQSIDFLISWRAIVAIQVDADTTIIKLQDSDDNSVFSDVDSEFVLGNPLATGVPNTNIVYKIGYVGKKQFVRMFVTSPTGNNTFNIRVFTLKGVPLNAPTPESA